MPLMQGNTDYAKSTNIKRLMGEGREQDQAVAIAMDVARRSKKAVGGPFKPRSKDELWDAYHAILQKQISLPPERQAELASKVKLARMLWEKAPEAKADGGGAGMPKLNVQPSRPRLHVGPIHSAVAGRTDHLPMHVPNKAYVLPADIVSGMGQGNTIAGFKIARNLPDIFHRMLYGSTPGATPFGQKSGAPYGHDMPGKHAKGGAAGHEAEDAPGVPIIAAGGEHVYSPDEIAKIGNGDIDLGHDILDAFVKHYRAEHIKTLQKLPGPKRD